MESIGTGGTWIKGNSSQSNYKRPRRLLLIADFVASCSAFAVGCLYMNVRGIVEGPLTISVVTSGAILLVTLVFMVRSRQYSAPKRLDIASAIGVLIRDLIMAAAATLLVSYLTKGFFTGLVTPSRLALGIAMSVFVALAILGRLVLGVVQKRQFGAGQGIRRILVAGDGTTADELIQLVSKRPQLGVNVVGRIHLDVAEWPRRSEHPAHLTAGNAHGVAPAHPEDLPQLVLADNLEGLRMLDEILHDSQAAEVIIALDPETQSALPKLAAFLDLAHVPFRVVPSLFEDTYRISELLGQTQIPVVELVTNPLDRLGRMTKRTMDMFVGSLVILVLLPLELLISLAILIDDGWPIIFAQERVGKNGRRFILYKFRTMVKDAENKLEELQARNELKSSDGLMFKIRQDPRITRVGTCLRKLSLDELPQFVNVLKGDMSVVGPRPPLAREVAKYEREHLARLRALPGITGLWQVSGRNELSFEDMVALDRYYLENWSLWTDIRIVLKTFLVILNRKGAY